jgi:hypothetical protein
MRVALPVLAGLLLGVAGLASTARHSDPISHGRRLSFWLQDHFEASCVAVPDTVRCALDEQAIQALGTNAIPLLLRWISSQPGPLDRLMTNLWIRFPGAPLPRWSLSRPNQMAYAGFHVLGRRLTETVKPALLKISGTKPGSVASRYATAVLASLEPAQYLTVNGFDPCSFPNFQPFEKPVTAEAIPIPPVSR